MGIKIKSDQLDTTNINSKTTNKSMFEFNDTVSVDSIIHVHSKNVTGLEMEIDKIEEKPEPNKNSALEEIVIEEKNEEKESLHNYQISAKPDVISDNPVTKTKIDEINDQNLVGNQMELSSQISNSFLDDQCILEAAVYFEKDVSKNTINKNPYDTEKNQNNINDKINVNNDIEKIVENKNLTNSNSKKPNLNTTIVSDDVLQLCNIFEKNVFSGRKSIGPIKIENTPKENKNNAVKRQLNYSFGEQTLKDILNSSIYNTQKSDEPLIAKSETIKKQNNIRTQLVEYIDNLSCSIRFKINVIENLNEFEIFINSVKSKSTFSFSIACDYLNEKPLLNDTYYIYHDETNERFIKFYGISIFLESCDKQIEYYFLLLNENKTFKVFIKKLLERDDVNKILFFTKNHYKLIYRAFGISLTMPVFDPIIANWLLSQEICNIFQIKQKYCSNINIIMDNELKQSKYCYGCTNLSYKSSGSSLNTYQRSFIESLIGLYCFDKIKLQLQLQNLWNYYVKIEAEILIICANVEINGFCLNFDELDSIKNKLIKKKKDIENKIKNVVGHEVNLNSTDQVASIIYDKLKLKPLVDQNKMNGIKFKHHSTSKDILNQLASQHEVPRLIILWRKITHTLSNSIYPVERVNFT